MSVNMFDYFYIPLSKKVAGGEFHRKNSDRCTNFSRSFCNFRFFREVENLLARHSEHVQCEINLSVREEDTSDDDCGRYLPLEWPFLGLSLHNQYLREQAKVSTCSSQFPPIHSSDEFLRGCQLDVWCSIMRSAWLFCFSEPSYNCTNLSEASLLLRNASRRLSSVKLLDLFPLFTKGASKSVILPLMPATTSVLVSTVEYWYLFFSELIYGTFETDRGLLVRQLILQGADLPKRYFISECLRFFFQLILKTGRFCALFRHLNWLLSVCEYLNTLESSAESFHNSDLFNVDKSFLGLVDCQCTLREAVFLANRRLASLVDCVNKTTALSSMTLNEDDLSLDDQSPHDYPTFRRLIEACFNLLHQLADIQGQIWDVCLTRAPTHPISTVSRSGSSSHFFLLHPSLPAACMIDCSHVCPPSPLSVIGVSRGWFFRTAASSTEVGTVIFLFYPACGETRSLDRPHFICQVPDSRATILHVVSHPHSRFFLLLTAEGRLYVWRLPPYPPSDSPPCQSCSSSSYRLAAQRSELEQRTGASRFRRSFLQTLMLSLRSIRQSSANSNDQQDRTPSTFLQAGSHTPKTKPSGSASATRTPPAPPLPSPTRPSWKVDLGKWLIGALEEHSTDGPPPLGSSIEITSLRLTGDDRLMIGTNTGHLLICQIFRSPMQISVLYLAPPPSLLNSLPALSAEKPYSFLGVTGMDNSANCLATIWDPTNLCQSALSHPSDSFPSVVDKIGSETADITSIRSLVAIYSRKKLIGEAVSSRKLTRIAAIASLVAVLNEDGEVYICHIHRLLASSKSSTFMRPSAEFAPRSPTLWTRVAITGTVYAMTTTFPESFVASDSPRSALFTLDSFSYAQADATVPGIVLLSRPGGPETCGGTAFHVSAVDGSVSPLNWIDNSLPGGLEGLEYIDESSCVAWHSLPPVFNTVPKAVTDPQSGHSAPASAELPPAKPFLPLLHPFVVEASQHTFHSLLDFILKALPSALSCEREVTAAISATACNLICSALKLLNIQLMVAKSRSFRLPDALAKKILNLLSSVIEETDRVAQGNLRSNGHVSLRAHAHACLTCGWSLLASHSVASLMASLEDQLSAMSVSRATGATAEPRSSVVIELLLSSLLAHYGEDAAYYADRKVFCPLLRTSAEGAGRLRRLLLNLAARNAGALPVASSVTSAVAQSSEQHALDNTFPLLSKLTKEVFDDTERLIMAEGPATRRNMRARSPTSTSGDQPPSAKCRRLLDGQYASTDRALLPNNDVPKAKGKTRSSHRFNSSCQQALDKMTLLVLMIQQELVTLLAKLALDEIEPSGSDAGSVAFPQSPAVASTLLALLVAHCHQVSEASIRVLRLTPALSLVYVNGVGVEVAPDLGTSLTPFQTTASHLHLSSCRGLTRILPHLTLNIIWLLKRCLRCLDRPRTHSASRFASDIISNVLPALLGDCSAPALGQVRDEARTLPDLLKYLDEINWRCCTDSYDLASTSLCPERCSIYRTWVESRPRFLLSCPPSLKLLHQRGIKAISDLKEPVVIHSLVYDFGLLNCAEGRSSASFRSLLSELAPLTARKELDVSCTYDRLPLSIAAREALSSCNVGWVWEGPLQQGSLTLYRVEALLVVAQMYRLRALLHESAYPLATSTAPAAFARFGCLANYRHSCLPTVASLSDGLETPLPAVLKYQQMSEPLSIAPSKDLSGVTEEAHIRLLHILLSDGLDAESRFVLIRFRAWLRAHLPLPKLPTKCSEAELELQQTQIAQDLSYLEQAVMATAVALAYHTGLSKLMTYELLQPSGKVPHLAPLERLLPALSRVVQTLISTHQTTGETYASMLNSLWPRCHFLCTRIEPLFHLGTNSGLGGFTRKSLAFIHHPAVGNLSCRLADTQLSPPLVSDTFQPQHEEDEAEEEKDKDETNQSEASGRQLSTTSPTSTKPPSRPLHSSPFAEESVPVMTSPHLLLEPQAVRSRWHWAFHMVCTAAANVRSPCCFPKKHQDSVSARLYSSLTDPHTRTFLFWAFGKATKAPSAHQVSKYVWTLLQQVPLDVVSFLLTKDSTPEEAMKAFSQEALLMARLPSHLDLVQQNLSLFLTTVKPAQSSPTSQSGDDQPHRAREGPSERTTIKSAMCSLAVAYLLKTPHQSKLLDTTNAWPDFFSRIFGDEMDRILSRFPSHIAETLLNRRLFFLLRLLSALRRQLDLAEDTLLVARLSSALPTVTVEDAEQDVLPKNDPGLLLEDLPNSKNLALAIHILAGALLPTNSERTPLPTTAAALHPRWRTPLSANSGFLLEDFLGLLRRITHLSGSATTQQHNRGLQGHVLKKQADSLLRLFVIALSASARDSQHTEGGEHDDGAGRQSMALRLVTDFLRPWTEPCRGNCLSSLVTDQTKSYTFETVDALSLTLLLVKSTTPPRQHPRQVPYSLRLYRECAYLVLCLLRHACLRFFEATSSPTSTELHNHGAKLSGDNVFTEYLTIILSLYVLRTALIHLPPDPKVGASLWQLLEVGIRQHYYPAFLACKAPIGLHSDGGEVDGKENASLLTGVLEELILLMRILLFASNPKVPQSSSAALPTWWSEGGLAEGMLYRLSVSSADNLVQSSSRWLSVLTVCAFLVGLDERPYIGSLVNFQEPTGTTDEAKFGLVTALTRAQCNSTPLPGSLSTKCDSRPSLSLLILPLESPEACTHSSSSSSPPPHSPQKLAPLHQPIRLEEGEPAPFSPPITRSVSPCDAKTELAGLLRWSSTLLPSLRSRRPSADGGEGNAGGSPFGDDAHLVACPLQKAIRVVFFPRPLSRIIQTECQRGETGLLTELAHLVVLACVCPDGTHVASMTQLFDDTETSSAVDQLVIGQLLFSMLLRLLHGLVEDLVSLVQNDSFLCQPARHVACASSQNHPPQAFSHFLTLMHSGVQSFSGTKEKDEASSIVNFTKLLLGTGLRPRIAVPPTALRPGVQVKSTYPKRTCFVMEESLLRPVENSRCPSPPSLSCCRGRAADLRQSPIPISASQAIPRLERINGSDQAGGPPASDPAAEEGYYLPPPISRLLAMGFRLRDILFAIEHLGGPSVQSMVERVDRATSSPPALGRDIDWPALPSIEALIDVMLLLPSSSPSLSLPPPATRPRDSRSPSWIEELCGASGHRPPPSASATAVSNVAALNPRSSTTISTVPTEYYSFFNLQDDEEENMFSGSIDELRAAVNGASEEEEEEGDAVWSPVVRSQGSQRSRHAASRWDDDDASPTAFDDVIHHAYSDFTSPSGNACHAGEAVSSSSSSSSSSPDFLSISPANQPPPEVVCHSGRTTLQRRHAQIFNRAEVQRTLERRRSQRLQRASSNPSLGRTSPTVTLPPVPPGEAPALSAFCRRLVNRAKTTSSLPPDRTDVPENPPSRRLRSTWSASTSPSLATSTRRRQSLKGSPTPSANSLRSFQVAIGDRVQICVHEPRWGWGKVTPQSIGKVTDKYFLRHDLKSPPLGFAQAPGSDEPSTAPPDGIQCVVQVRFPEQSKWTGPVSEVRRVVTCGGSLHRSSSSSSASAADRTSTLSSASWTNPSTISEHCSLAHYAQSNPKDSISAITVGDVWKIHELTTEGSDFPSQSADRLWVYETLASTRASELLLEGWRAERELLLGLVCPTRECFLESTRTNVSGSPFSEEARRRLSSRVRKWFGESVPHSPCSPTPPDRATGVESHLEEDCLRTDVGNVFAWGLNDKEQLGGPRGSKIKLPQFNSALSVLRPVQVVGGSKCLFVVTEEGDVYACGDTSGGKLGLGSPSQLLSALPIGVTSEATHEAGRTSDGWSSLPTPNVQRPRLLEELSGRRIVKVAAHSGSKHTLALTADGSIFAWGDGAAGQLGLGDRASCHKPQALGDTHFGGETVVDVAVGSGYSAAITASGELFTWGSGKSGRLGHGDMEDRLVPTKVSHFAGLQVIQVACGSRGAQTLALTSDGRVWAWGDGEFGKLGLGNSESYSLPTPIPTFTSHLHQQQQHPVVFLGCGAQFSVALTASGRVFTWGKADYYRLGHGDLNHVNVPTCVKAFASQRVVQVAVGALHCLAVTDTGRVYSWGDNDHGQLGNGLTVVNKMPSVVLGLPRLPTNALGNFRIACGSSHSVAYLLPTGCDSACTLSTLSTNFHLAATFEAAQATLETDEFPAETTAQSSAMRLPTPTVAVARRWQRLRCACPSLTGTAAGALFPDAPTGPLGRLYTEAVFKSVCEWMVESTFRSSSGPWGSSEISNHFGYKPVPFPVPTRDPLGFSYLGLSDGYTENFDVPTNASMRQQPTTTSSGSYCLSEVGVPSATTAASETQPDPGEFCGVQLPSYCHFVALGLQGAVESGPVLPVEFGAGLLAGTSERRIQRLASLLPRGYQITGGDGRTDVISFNRLADVMLQSIQTEITRDLASLLLLWISSRSQHALPVNTKKDDSKFDTEAKPKMHTLSKILDLRQSPFKFSDWLDPSVLLQWLDLIRIYLKESSASRDDVGAGVESFWSQPVGQPVTAADHFLRLHVSWLLTALELTSASSIKASSLASQRLQTLLCEYCLLELESFSLLVDAACVQSSTSSSQQCSRSRLRGEGLLQPPPTATLPLSFPQLVERGVDFFQHSMRLTGADQSAAQGVPLLPDTLTLVSPSLKFVQIFLLTGIIESCSKPQQCIQWLASLAHLALCPGTNKTNLTRSASLQRCWQAREWAVGALLRLLSTAANSPLASPLYLKLVNTVRKQMTRLTGSGGSCIGRTLMNSGSTPTTPGVVNCSLHQTRTISLASPLTLPATPSQPLIVAQSVSSKNLQGVETDTFAREVAFHLNWFLEMLPSALQQQFAYERPEVVDGNQLSHSRFFLRLILLVLELGCRQLPLVQSKPAHHNHIGASRSSQDPLLVAHPFAPGQGPIHQLPSSALASSSRLNHPPTWTWFSRLASCLDLLRLLLERRRTRLPDDLIAEFESSFPPQVFLAQMPASSSSCSETFLTADRSYLDEELFGLTEDMELVHWVRTHPHDWEECWSHGYNQVWAFGQNDSGQLGGLEGRIVRTPCMVERLCELSPISLFGGFLTLFAVTDTGEVHASGYAHNDRLGAAVEPCAFLPVRLTSLSSVRIVKLAVHPLGQHCLALDTEGNVYSWGTQTHGRLGHGSVIVLKGPRVIDSLSARPHTADSKSFRIVDIFAGYAHSAAITEAGELYTWGHGLTGSLGHGDTKNQRRPKLVEALCGHRVVEVACAGEHTPVLALTPDEDAVWHWGNVTFEKWDQDMHPLPTLPIKLQALQGRGIIHVANGGSFSVALSRSGSVYTWGAEMRGALGHSVRSPLLTPTLLSALAHTRITSLACGSAHCLAIDENQNVYSWGANDQGQLGDGTSTSRATPRIIISFGKRRAFQVACGSSHSFVIIRDPYSSGAAKITTTTVAESACTSIFPRKYSETPRTRHDGSLLAAAVHVDTHLPPAFLGPLPSRGPPPEYHALNNLVLRTQATANSIRPLVLLRNRFLFLQWVAKLTCGGEYSRSAADNADPIMGGVTLVNSTLIGSRLQTSAFFGFWPLIGQVVGDGLSTDRLAALISPSPLHSDLVTVDNRLDMLASLLLVNSKEILLRRILQSTTHPALFHGPEIRVTRLSTNLDRSDIPHPRSYRDPRSDATAREPVNPLKSVFAQVSRRMLQMNEFGAPCSNEDPDGVVGACEPVVAEEEMREASHLHRARAWLANQLTAGRPTLIPRPPRLQVPPQPHFWLSRRAWKVSLVGESVDDCGGGFSDSVAEICDELHAPWSGLPVLVPCSPLTESGRSQEIAPSSNFIINPDCAVLAPAWLVFLGCLMGIGVRTGHSLHLRLAQPIWRLLCGRRSGIRLSEMISLDAEVSATGFDLLAIAKMPNEELERAELPFTCLSANRCHSVDLIQFVRELAFCSQPCIETDCLHLFLSKSTNHSPTPPPSSAPDVLWSSVQASARVALSEFMSAPAVSMEMTEPPTPNASEACPGARLCVKPDTRPAYLMAVILFRRQEFERAIRLVRRGLAQVLPIGVLSLFTGEELECLVCGAPEIPVEALQQLVTYDNLAPDDQLVLWFWTIVSEMTNWERSLLLRFVWGRSRLPRFPSDLRERQFHIRVQMDYHPPDSYLPEGSTCLFTLRLPQYSSLAVFRERLRYAIFSCRSIDSDDLTMLE